LPQPLKILLVNSSNSALMRLKLLILRSGNNPYRNHCVAQNLLT
jgi:hypothetical protein